MGDRSDDGRRGEEAATRHLVRRGWTILASRWRGAGGELDLVAARGHVVAFCEVKTRARGVALREPVTGLQRARIARAAEAFLAAHPDLAERAVRLDLITVRLGRRWTTVRHRPGVIGET
jgi:putative endonuclease